MSIFGHLAREVMRQQAYKNRRRHRSGWGFGPPPRRRSRHYSSWGGPRGGYYPMRRQSRSNVRVVGCCLPIPIGVMALGAGLTTAVRRAR